jgi:hypothetical protein
MKQIDGRKAVVINSGNVYSMYAKFAERHGYPDAVAPIYRSDKRERLNNGEIVTLLVNGPHDARTQGILWIVEKANGDRYVINESGLRIKDAPAYKTAELRAIIDNLTKVTECQTEAIANLARRVAEMERKCNPTPTIGAGKRFDAEVVEADVERKAYGDWVKVASGPVSRCKPSFVRVTRDEVVDRAKADVADLLRKIGEDSVGFNVNREERTVVAYAKRRRSVFAKNAGIARCAPGDVFNTHIGKAIAVRRALGLTVPDDYVNAPKPTEVRVGDVVAGRTGRTFSNGNKTVRVKEIRGNDVWFDIGTYLHESKIVVVDDSRDGVTE